jgi:hypothetical protein
MKARILSVFVAVIGFSSVLALAVAAQGLRSDRVAGWSGPPHDGSRDVRPQPEGDLSPGRPDAPLGAPSALVYDVTCDDAGNCWYAHWNGLSVRSASGQWTDFSTSDGLAHPYCWDVAIDDSGLVWVGHHFVGVSLLDYNGTLSNKSDDTWLTFTPADGLVSERVHTVEIAPDGHVWFGLGTTESRIAILDHKGTPFNKADDQWSSYDDGDFGDAAGPVNAILFHGNDVWAGTDFGLVRNTGGSWEEIEWPGVPGCLECCWGNWPVGHVWDLAADDQGHIWVADGLCGAAGYDGSQWTVCDVGDSSCPLSEITGSPDDGMRSVAVDEYGNKWFGTRHNRGAARLDGYTDWTIFTQTDDPWLTTSDIETIDFDVFGNGWFAGSSISQYVVPGSSSGYVLASSGGTVRSPDRLAKAEFPAGSVDQDAEVTIEPANSPPTGQRFGVYIFDMSAVISGTTTPVTSFDPDYTLTVKYTEMLRSAAIESTLALYWWDNAAGEWVEESTSGLDTATKTVSATVDHMTYFGLLGDSLLTYVPLTLRGY